MHKSCGPAPAQAGFVYPQTRIKSLTSSINFVREGNALPSKARPI